MTNTALSHAIRQALLTITALSAVSLPMHAAQAQTTEADDQGTEEADATTLDRIEVTGSRLKRADIEGAVPVIVIDREQIDASGDVSVADVLRDSTFASFGNFRPVSGSSAQSLASIDLRGLGSGRTLVLINGRRAPTNPMSASSGADVNAIPLAAVERIEILSDGASAIYGSDAIGGVVNIILRKDFNGVELRYGIQQTEVKGGDQEAASVTFGVSGDRGRLIGGVGMMSRDNVFTRDQIGYEPGASTYGNNYYEWNIGGAVRPDDPTTDFDESTSFITAVPGYACDDPGFYPTPSNGRCAYDFNLVAANQASIKNKSLFLMGDYQINDDWSVYANATVTQIESFGRYAPAPGIFIVEDGSPNDINYGVMVADNPAAPTDGLPTYFFHRFAAAGNRDNQINTTNSDFLLGFEGQLVDTVGVDFGFRRTRYQFQNRGNGYIVATLASAAANDGFYDVRDPFGASEATLKGMTATTSRVATWNTDEIYGLINFDLFEMGGGISNAVVGAEYREDVYVNQFDSLSEAKQPNGLPVLIGSAGSSAAGSRTVGAAYFEWLFPIATTFDFTLAGRYDRYSDYGSDFSPKVALRWQPLDNLTIRGSYGQGFRAPGLDILTQKPAFSAVSVGDPQTCVARGKPANCSGEQVDTIFKANPNLSSEHSDQYSLGVVYDPTDWLDLSLDYYHIKIEDLIGQISAQSIINSDLNPATFGPIPPGMSITRRPSGEIKQIIAGYANRGELETDGLDLRANTDFDLGGMGRLQNHLMVSWINKFEITDTGGTTDFIGLLGNPQWRANLQNIWTMGDWSVVYGINYIDGQKNPDTLDPADTIVVGEQVGGYATNDLQVAWEAPWNAQIAVGATNIGNRYPELESVNGRPWNFALYDAYGRTTYFRYTQRF